MTYKNTFFILLVFGIVCSGCTQYNTDPLETLKQADREKTSAEYKILSSQAKKKGAEALATATAFAKEANEKEMLSRQVLTPTTSQDQSSILSLATNAYAEEIKHDRIASVDDTMVGSKEPIGIKKESHKPATLALSKQGADFIKKLEGFIPCAVWDYKQYSIGYGTKSKNGECITKEQAEKRFTDEIARYEQSVRNTVNVPLTQEQFDSLVSFSYNLGEKNLKNLVFHTKLNDGMYEKVPDVMKDYHFAGGKPLNGLKKRRQSESILFSSGLY